MRATNHTYERDNAFTLKLISIYVCFSALSTSCASVEWIITRNVVECERKRKPNNNNNKTNKWLWNAIMNLTHLKQISIWKAWNGFELYQQIPNTHSKEIEENETADSEFRLTVSIDGTN